MTVVCARAFARGRDAQHTRYLLVMHWPSGRTSLLMCNVQPHRLARAAAAHNHLPATTVRHDSGGHARSTPKRTDCSPSGVPVVAGGGLLTGQAVSRSCANSE